MPQRPGGDDAHARHDPPAGGGHDYGSSAANDAVAKLEGLGASVYPPESKDDMDWGVLAGRLHQPWLESGGADTCLSQPGQSAADVPACSCQPVQSSTLSRQAGAPSHFHTPAGYDEQKAMIEDTLLLALKHPEVGPSAGKRTVVVQNAAGRAEQGLRRAGF